MGFLLRLKIVAALGQIAANNDATPGQKESARCSHRKLTHDG